MLKVYDIKQVNYHYYYELTEYMDKCHDDGWEVIQILEIEASHSHDDKMHRATLLIKKILC
jgi:hypothetical protein